MSSLESKASTPSAGHPPQAKEAGGGVKKTTTTVQGSMGTPWQQLLSLPPQQMLVIERMHSGARRFVVLDFGAPILLTGMSLSSRFFHSKAQLQYAIVTHAFVCYFSYLLVESLPRFLNSDLKKSLAENFPK